MKNIFSFLVIIFFTTTAFAMVFQQNKTEKLFSSDLPIKERWNLMMELARDQQTPMAVFQRAAQDKDCFMRNAGLVAMSHRHPEESLKLAEKLIKDKALVVRSAALDVMKKHSHKMNRELLWKELDQKYNFRGQQSLWIRKDIVELLSLAPQTSEKNKFKALLNDKDLDVRLQVSQVINQIK